MEPDGMLVFIKASLKQVHWFAMFPPQSTLHSTVSGLANEMSEASAGKSSVSVAVHIRGKNRMAFVQCVDDDNRLLSVVSAKVSESSWCEE
jgi:hypothetical protein